MNSVNSETQKTEEYAEGFPNPLFFLFFPANSCIARDMDRRQASAGEVLGKLGLHTVALLHERIAAERRTSIERRNTIERRGSVSLSLKQRGPAIPPQTLSPEQKEIKRRIKKRQETGWASAPDRAYRPLGTPDLVRPKGSVAKVAKDEVPPFGGARDMTSGLATPGQGTGGPSSGRGADGTRKMSEFMQAVKSVEKTAGDDTSSAMSGGGVSMKKANLV